MIDFIVYLGVGISGMINGVCYFVGICKWLIELNLLFDEY